MGVLVIHPSTPGYRPSPQQEDSLIDLLRREQFIGKPFASGSWEHGPEFDRLGITALSNPAVFSLRVVQEVAIPDPDAEDWERTLAQQVFWISIQDAAFLEEIDRSDPIWAEMERALGVPLSHLYYHV